MITGFSPSLSFDLDEFPVQAASKRQVLSNKKVHLFFSCFFMTGSFNFFDCYTCLRARNISRLPPGGPGKRSTTNPAVCNILRITPLAQ